MRQRKAKDLEKRLQACSRYLLNCSADDAKSSFFDDEKELYLEIGCGKGNFIIKKALDHPDKNFIAIEGQETVILRALEKAAGISGCHKSESSFGGEDGIKPYARVDEAGFSETKMADGSRETELHLCRAESGIRCKTNGAKLSNLKFMLTFVHRMEEFFEEGQLSGIYLNFSDPWPKARHAKRRLTYRTRLQDYAWALKKGGFVEFKTDNEDLYQFTLAEIAAAGYKITEQTVDLHGSCYESRFTTTEYEEKFKTAGKNINYVKFVVS